MTSVATIDRILHFVNIDQKNFFLLIYKRSIPVLIFFSDRFSIAVSDVICIAKIVHYFAANLHSNPSNAFLIPVSITMIIN